MTVGIKYTVLLYFFFTLSVSTQTFVWNKEAEDADLLGDAYVKDGCSNASGGGYFVDIGSKVDDGIEFSDITITEAGEYGFQIHFFCVSDLQMELFVNGDLAEIVDFPEANWCFQGVAQVVNIPINMIKGNNSIALKVHNGQQAPFVDKVALTKKGGISREPVKYFLSSSDGNDSWNGLKPDSALRSLSKLNELVLVPGDSVFFKAGDVFLGQLNVSSSGTEGRPIYFGRYGNGSDPILDGANAENGSFMTTIFINNQEFIEIADLEITNDRLIEREGEPNELAYGIYVLNNANKILQHFHFHDLKIRDIYAISPDILINAKNTYIYNNIFSVSGFGSIGNNLDISIETGSELKISNNLFHGNVNSDFANMDKSSVFGDPRFLKAEGSGADSYQLKKDSKALNAGLSFPEPSFPMAGKGIFKDVDLYPQFDFFGNAVNVSEAIPNIGAFNGQEVDNGVNDFEIIDSNSMKTYPNPIKDKILVSLNARKYGEISIYLIELRGRVVQSERFEVQQGTNILEFFADSALRNGIFLVSIKDNGIILSKRVVLAKLSEGNFKSKGYLS